MNNSEQIPAWLEQVAEQTAKQSGHAKQSRTVTKTRSAPPSGEQYELEQQTFAIAFESLLPFIAEGSSLSQFCRSYLDTNSQPLSASRFRAWIFKSTKRREAYYGAKALGADALEEELTRLSDGLDPDGNPTLNDVARSTLQINTRKWLMQVNNRERYGDVKRVEQSVTKKFDPSQATMQQLGEKLAELLGASDEDDSIAINGELFESDPE